MVDLGIVHNEHSRGLKRGLFVHGAKNKRVVVSVRPWLAERTEHHSLQTSPAVRADLTTTARPPVCQPLGLVCRLWVPPQSCRLSRVRPSDWWRLPTRRSFLAVYKWPSSLPCNLSSRSLCIIPCNNGPDIFFTSTRSNFNRRKVK